MNMNDGGPAFPSEQGHTPKGTWNQTYNFGMSLLNWSAGQALCGLLARYAGSFPTDEAIEEAYDYAAGMLRERERRTQEGGGT
jgi:hypothetical protein